MFIYVITCLVNGKQYVGRTSGSIESRWKGHVKHSRSPTSTMLVTRAIRKYGEDQFTISKLVECFSREELNRTEVEKIEELNTRHPNGYNIDKGGGGGTGHRPGEDHPMWGKKHTDETKKLMSEAQKGKHLKDRHRPDCKCWICRDSSGEKNPQFGKPLNENQIRAASINAKKMGLANRGRVLSEEAKLNIGKGNKGKVRSPETRINMKFAQLLRRLYEREIAAIAVGDYRG